MGCFAQVEWPSALCDCTFLTNVTSLLVEGPLGAVPELVFEKKQVVSAVQQLLLAYPKRPE